MRADLLWFEFTQSLPVVWRILRKALGVTRTIRTLGWIVRLGIFSDPFRSLPKSPPPSSGELYTRQMVRSALLLDGALRTGLGLEDGEAHSLLREVVSTSGAAYIRANLTIPSIGAWKRMNQGQQEGFAQGVLSRFENMEAQIVTEDGSDFGFDVHQCHFADLCRQLGREDLAPLFCEADSVYFGDPLVPVRLDRKEKLSVGDSRCAFRFRLESPALDSET